MGPAVFRLDDHLKRLFNSAKALEIKIPYTLNDLKKTTLDLIKINKIKDSYIRPIIFYGYGKMGLNPAGAKIDCAIALWSWPKYLTNAAKVKISKFIRPHPKSIISKAKVCGHYVNSILASLEAHHNGYDEAILLDYNGYVAEGPGENIFLVKNNVLYTPKPGSILTGITRDSIIKIAKDLGYKVIEKNILPKELFEADELFFTGTAAEITPIAQINNKKKKIGEITLKFQSYYKDIVTGKIKKYFKWLSFVK